MENKKKISLFLTKLKLAYPRYFEKLEKEDFIGLSNMLEEMLERFNEATLNEVANKIIKTKKFMPTIAEILEICEDTKVYVQNVIVEEMIKDGYFKSPLEIDKIYMWMGEGIIPQWFRKDMMKYYNKMIENKKLLIEG